MVPVPVEQLPSEHLLPKRLDKFPTNKKREREITNFININLTTDTNKNQVVKSTKKRTSLIKSKPEETTSHFVLSIDYKKPLDSHFGFL